MEPLARERRLELRFHYGPNTYGPNTHEPDTHGPGTLVRLPQEAAYALVSNLVLNAIQHSRAGAPVAVRVARQGPSRVVLEVSDAGTGIARDALPHVFERFYREDGSRSRETGGTGLGLAICKSIVEAADGEISITSEVDAGTTVTAVFSAA
jgi:signal transduction histidine kinase